MEAEQKGHSTFKPKRNQPKELTPISEEDSFRLVPSSQFISLLKVMLHEHKRGPLVDGDQLNLLGTMCHLDSPLEKEHLNVNYQYCVADLWLLSLSAASKVYGATFKPSCDKSQKETIIQKLGLKPIQSADKYKLLRAVGFQQKGQELVASEPAHQLNPLVDKLNSKVPSSAEDGGLLGKRARKTSKDSQKPHLDEVMDLTGNMRENSDRVMPEPKPKSAGVQKTQSAIQPKLPGNREHGLTASSSGPGLSNPPKARPNQRGVSLQRPTTSSQPVKLDIDSDLPIILVPSFHSRAEIVLENFSQMFVNGRYVEKGSLLTPRKPLKRKGSSTKRDSEASRDKALAEQGFSGQLTYEYRDKKYAFQVTDDVTELLRLKKTSKVVCWFLDGNPYLQKNFSTYFQESSPAKLFDRGGLWYESVRGYYFKIGENKIPEEYKKWNIKILEIPSSSRHKDTLVQAQFWEDLSSFLTKQFN